MTSDNFRDFAGNQPVGSDEQNEDYSDSSGAAEDVLSILEQLAVDGLVLEMAMLFDIWIITRRNHRSSSGQDKKKRRDIVCIIQCSSTGEF